MLNPHGHAIPAWTPAALSPESDKVFSVFPNATIVFELIYLCQNGSLFSALFPLYFSRVFREASLIRSPCRIGPVRRESRGDLDDGTHLSADPQPGSVKNRRVFLYPRLISATSAGSRRAHRFPLSSVLRAGMRTVLALFQDRQSRPVRVRAGSRTSGGRSGPSLVVLRYPQSRRHYMG